MVYLSQILVLTHYISYILNMQRGKQTTLCVQKNCCHSVQINIFSQTLHLGTVLFNASNTMWPQCFHCISNTMALLAHIHAGKSEQWLTIAIAVRQVVSTNQNCHFLSPERFPPVDSKEKVDVHVKVKGCIPPLPDTPLIMSVITKTYELLHNSYQQLQTYL